MIAVADIGGTHARFALAEIDGDNVTSLGAPFTLRTAEHASFELAWQEFELQSGSSLPHELGMALAGPANGEQLKLTNNPWVMQPALMAPRLGIERLHIVNDFGAVAHAVAKLGDDQFDHLCGPDGPLPATGVTSVVGPGTGLGVAQLVKVPDGYHVIETEGGHVDFASLDALEDNILAHLRLSFRRVSVERMASGSALTNIHGALAAIEGKAIRHADEKSLWASALEGSDSLAVAALDRFFLSLGAIAGDQALAHGANAVVIAGGLAYRIRDRFKSSGFANRFIAKGRFERRMEAIPVKLVTHPEPGLYGAAVAFAKEYA